MIAEARSKSEIGSLERVRAVEAGKLSHLRRRRDHEAGQAYAKRICRQGHLKN